MNAILVILLGLLSEADTIYPVEYKGIEKVDVNDPTLNNLSWHKWQTKDFAILSIHEQQGLFLSQNIGQIKSWIFGRWGLPNINFNAECRLFCVHDKDLMKKLFNGLDGSRVEIRKKQGRIEVAVGWLLLNDSPGSTLPVPLTEICLAELFESTGNVSYSLIRGMSKLNCPVEMVRNELKELAQLVRKSPSVYFSEPLFNSTRWDYEKLKPEDKRLFDGESIVLCLLLRKEFGEDKLVNFLKNGTSESALRTIYGFRDFKQFDASFARYMKDLLSDVSIGKTPDSYLDINPKDRRKK